MKLLVLGSGSDPHVAAVVEVLRERGVTVAVYDETAPPGATLALDETGALDSAFEELPVAALEAVDLIWLRLKPIFRRKWLENNDAFPGERAKFVAYRQWGLFYDNLIALFDGPMIDDPAARQAQANKLWQQRLAGELGLSTPPTLVTTQKSKALAFLDAHGAIIVKPLGAANVPRPDDPTRTQALTTAPVARDDLEQADDSQLSLCPAYFQKYIEKKFELRVVFIGEKIFSYRIHSQDHELAKIDWRLGAEQVNFELSEIDETLVETLRAYMKRSRLTTASFDLIIDPDGRPWFLECNPDGQWYWLDAVSDGAIRRAYAEHLVTAARQRHCTESLTG